MANAEEAPVARRAWEAPAFWRGTADAWRAAKPGISAAAWAAEPRLQALEARVRWIAVCDAVESPTAFCANDAFIGRKAFAGEGHPVGGVKGEIERLLGYARHRDPGADPLLATSNAYDAAFEVRYALLPACRGGCGCTGPASPPRR
jgi:hypothetical protein